MARFTKDDDLVMGGDSMQDVLTKEFQKSSDSIVADTLRQAASKLSPEPSPSGLDFLKNPVVLGIAALAAFFMLTRKKKRRR
jgi:hypothetical protein